MLPMECPSCRSNDNRVQVSNYKLADQVVRRRACNACNYRWYTVESRVPDYVIGWSSPHSSKPVLRQPLEVRLSHVEEPGLAQLAEANGKARGVAKCERPAS